jgi:hypothetical protein
VGVSGSVGRSNTIAGSIPGTPSSYGKFTEYCSASVDNVAFADESTWITSSFEQLRTTIPMIIGIAKFKHIFFIAQLHKLNDSPLTFLIEKQVIGPKIDDVTKRENS